MMPFHICRDLRQKQGSHTSECPANEISIRLKKPQSPLILHAQESEQHVANRLN
jgi:hypothetical protein